MSRKLIIALVIFFILLLNNHYRPFRKLRSYLERQLIIPIRKATAFSQDTNNESLRILSLKEEISSLKQENQALRRQLGAIPERANLLSATVVWQSSNQYVLEFPYRRDRELIGHPVVWGEIYLGKVKRVGERLLVVQKPTSSSFVAQAENQNRTAGQILGQYNEQVVFETSVENQIAKGDRIYLLEPEHSWRFLVGTVTSISRNKRLPVKQAMIDYLPSQTSLTTVFVVE